MLVVCPIFTYPFEDNCVLFVLEIRFAEDPENGGKGWVSEWASVIELNPFSSISALFPSFKGSYRISRLAQFCLEMGHEYRFFRLISILKLLKYLWYKSFQS